MAAALGVIGALALAPAARAGKTSDPLYDFLLADTSAEGATYAITSDGTGLYSEPLDASGAYWSMSPMATRSFTLNLRDGDGVALTDNGGNAALDYGCVAGSYMATDTNPFITCYADKEQTRGFHLDYPPYGNATKQTMKEACTVVSRPDVSTYVAEAPATCRPKVWRVNGGRNAPSWIVEAPFHFESHLQQ